MATYVRYGTGGALNPRYNRVQPQNRRQATLWAEANSWDWYPINVWPAVTAQYWIAPRLGYRARWHLMLFFIGNGMSPQLAFDRMMDRMGRATVDQEEHLRDIANDADDMLQRYGYWDMYEQRRVPGSGRVNQ